MKSLVILSIMLFSASSFAFGKRNATAILCGKANTAAQAVQELNTTLASNSGTFWTDKLDGDNKRLAIKFADIESVSAITIITPGSTQYKYDACVTVTAQGTDE